MHLLDEADASGSPLVSITYLSTATRHLTEDELGELLAQSRRSNGAAGVTGALLYADRSFIQTLEGPDAAVRATFERIAADQRHRGIEVVLDDTTSTRNFPEWNMGFHSLDRSSRPDVARLVDGLTARDPDRSLTAAGRRAQKFHDAFRRLSR